MVNSDTQVLINPLAVVAVLVLLVLVGYAFISLFASIANSRSTSYISTDDDPPKPASKLRDRTTYRSLRKKTAKTSQEYQESPSTSFRSVSKNTQKAASSDRSNTSYISVSNYGNTDYYSDNNTDRGEGWGNFLSSLFNDSSSSSDSYSNDGGSCDSDSYSDDGGSCDVD